MSATLHDLEERVNQKEFRADLYERLGIVVHLPALRDRKEDFSLIVRQVLSDLGRESLYGQIKPSTYAWMAERPWNGNLRELAKVLRLTVELFELNGVFDVAATYRGYRVTRDTAKDGDGTASVEAAWLEALVAKGTPLEAIHEETTRRVLTLLWRECDGKVARIAERLQIGRARARAWLDKLQLRATDESPGKPR